jgi:hypothetical protein
VLLVTLFITDFSLLPLRLFCLWQNAPTEIRVLIHSASSHYIKISTFIMGRLLRDSGLPLLYAKVAQKKQNDEELLYS